MNGKTLANIQHGDVVKYRIGRGGPHDVNWKPWKTGPMYVVRRENTIKGGKRRSHRKGEIIQIFPMNDDSAEFSIEDYCHFTKCFCFDDYYLQLDILDC